MPRPWTWLTGLIVVIALTAAMFLATAEYSRKESVRGWLVSREGVARISHSTAGVVESIVTTSGDTVQAGDPILYLSRNTFLEDGRNSGDELLMELRKQVDAIERRAGLLRAKADIEKKSIRTQLEGIEKQQGLIARRETEQQRRLDVSRDKLLRLKAAARDGAVTRWEVMRQEDEQAVLQQVLGQMKQSEIALKGEFEQLNSRIRSLPIETERSISRLDSERSQLQQRITELESRQRVVLKSPIAGKLASVEIHQGGTVAPNQLLATVLPEELALVAEVYVPSSAVGFIEHGQNVRLMYDAFPQQQFGAFSGRVERVSDFVLLPSEVPQTFFLREATFKVHISIESDSIAMPAGSAMLRPGMLLAAEIILENRSLADWLLEPLRLRRKETT